MSLENKTDEILGKVFIFVLVAFIFSIYCSWNDSVVYRLLNYNANAAEEVGLFTRIICMFVGTLSGTIFGVGAYLIHILLTTVTQFSSKSSHYIILGWLIVIIGVVGGTSLGVKYILLWMA